MHTHINVYIYIHIHNGLCHLFSAGELKAILPHKHHHVANVQINISLNSKYFFKTFHKIMVSIIVKNDNDIMFMLYIYRYI